MLMKGITLMCGDSSPVIPHLSLFIPEYFVSEMQKKKKGLFIGIENHNDK